jgi:hypothetical protein
MTFKGFAVRNEGSATDWLEMSLGSQNFIFENLFFIGGTGGGGTHTPFTRSVIHSEVQESVIRLLQRPVLRKSRILR